ncbi:spore protease YyaC [Alicyclobacillus cycloheptanicus]|uniref:Sporulation protein YyaC n=1 Tax=Alicyclobacillus cycloheptanicus TaxID=1457 RepID=A0ABT9XEU6_9BACL|nr:spore protease YyaC [Alicyclobacillus cycloheptanicus]MDQ0188817.1 putative sporulation protein YyaC [Alicyclobacillus cycloheptanicus]WDM00534.1 spore protease YyaC [Alicyclobacillus cycloheptanicus]
MDACRVHAQSKAAAATLSRRLARIFAAHKDVVVVCIGTPAVPGDAFGPMVGSALRRSLPIPVYGTLHHPVAALELPTIRRMLRAKHRNATVIAVDAALGYPRTVQFIKIVKGGIQPGRGLGRRWGSIGDYAIQGIVSPRTKDPLRALEQTPHRLVKSMANVTSTAIVSAWRRTHRRRSRKR